MQLAEAISSGRLCSKQRLGDLVTRLTNGYVGPTRDIYCSTGVPYLLAKHVKNNRLEFDGQTFITGAFNAANAKSILREGDVLLVQTGHIGHSAVVPKLHDGHNCHAMIVITPKPELFGPYLSYYFSSSAGQAAFKRIQTGATLKHLNCRDVKEMLIPMPPLNEQKRIAEILNRVEDVLDMRRRSISLADDLLVSAFIECFGNPLDNPSGFPLSPLPKVATIARGRFSPRPRNDPQYYGGDYPFIQTGDIVRAGVYVTKHTQTLNEKGLRVSKQFPAGTIAITIAANIGETSILTYDTCFPDSVVGLQANSQIMIPEFLRFQLQLLKEHLISRATQTAQKNINVETLNSLTVMVPPLELQRHFAKVVFRVLKISDQMKIQATQLDRWHAALQAELFSQTDASEVNV